MKAIAIQTSAGSSLIPTDADIRVLSRLTRVLTFLPKRPVSIFPTNDV
jgi:hypothetical protein